MTKNTYLFIYASCALYSMFGLALAVFSYSWFWSFWNFLMGYYFTSRVLDLIEENEND